MIDRNENCFARAFGGDGGRVNAGGDAPPDPPLLVTSWAIPPFFVFLQKVFYVEAEGRSGERDGIRHARERFFFPREN